jgi:hypothetical protein
MTQHRQFSAALVNHFPPFGFRQPLQEGKERHNVLLRQCVEPVMRKADVLAEHAGQSREARLETKCVCQSGAEALEQLLPGNGISWGVTNISCVRLAILFLHEFLLAD